MKGLKVAAYLFSALSLFTALTACATSFSLPIRGQVLEEGTERPIAGAIVTVLWEGQVSAFVESRSVCTHVETATSDEQGYYRTQGWRAKPSVSARTGPVPIGYKPGYRHSRREGGTVYLKPFTGDREERLEYLLRVSSATRCGNAGVSEKNLLALKKALYEEAKTIAFTSKDQEKVETLLFGLESLQFGSIEALNRMTEHRKGKK